MIDNSDLKIATESIIKGLKILNNKVSSVSTVLEDVQAASINRQYSSLIKNIDLLKSLAECGKSQVIRKKLKTLKSKQSNIMIFILLANKNERIIL